MSDSSQDPQQTRPCPPGDSNPQFQQASGRRFEPYVARSLGSAFQVIGTFKVLPSGLESLILVYIIIITVVIYIDKCLNKEIVVQ